MGMTSAPRAPQDQIVLLDLDESGAFIELITKKQIRLDLLAQRLKGLIPLDPEVTDIFIYVHGWRNTREGAALAARRLANLIREQARSHGALYPKLWNFKPLYVVLRWPSQSSPLPWGYRRIRDRAHAMTTNGHAEFALAHVLGYFNSERRPPTRAAPTLRTKGGQYLHCVGHSFGGRFLCEAIMAADNPVAPTLGWPWTDVRYPYTADTLLVFQMATRPDDFAGRYAKILTDSAISGPVVLTFSRADRALGLWHRAIERMGGLGSRGATLPRESIQAVRLPRASEPFTFATTAGRIVNVDCTWCFRRGRFSRFEGAHSDIWYPESANLLLSLAEAARP
jgi:hypothetical protein